MTSKKGNGKGNGNRRFFDYVLRSFGKLRIRMTLPRGLPVGCSGVSGGGVQSVQGWLRQRSMASRKSS